MQQRLCLDRRVVTTLALATLVLVAVAGTPLFGLTAECAGEPVVLANGPGCGLCPEPTEVVLSDGTCVPLSTFCDVLPGEPATVSYACTAAGEDVSVTCTIEVADAGRPLLQCDSIQLGCGAASLPAAPVGAAPCGQPTTTECFVCTDPGGACEPQAAGLVPWDEFAPGSPGPYPYVCTATIQERVSMPGHPAAENTNWCTDFIQPATGDFDLIIVPREPAPLWPPDHQVTQHSILESCIEDLFLINPCTGQVTEIDPSVISLQISHITSSEPDDAEGTAFQEIQGDGATVCDIQILAPGLAQLRRERSGQGRGEGRTYNVFYDISYTDPDGGVATGSGICEFSVPHSLRQQVTPTNTCLSCVGTGCETIPSCEVLPPDCNG